MKNSGDAQDDSQEGRQNERQETTNSDKVGRNGETACSLREKVPRPLKKNVSISNMAEEYGFGGSFDPVDFDELFVNSGRYRPKLNHMSRYVGSIDEGISSSIDIDSGEEDNIPTDFKPAQLRKQASASKISRVDSVMEQTFQQMIVNNFEKSQGYLGFRRRVANDMNHKYCSFCRCDDTLFIFLHVVFGIVCIIAGVFGVMECSSFGSLNYYLFLEGIACIFLFPILIMKWAKHVGGCLHDDQKVGKGIFFIVVLIMRISSAILGTILFLLYVEYFVAETIVCHFVQKTFLTVMIFGWSFLVFVIFTPFCWYGSLLCVAKFLHVRQLGCSEEKAVDYLDSFTDEKAVASEDDQI